ncbi:PepSY-associated TM helix domain-containing protein [Sphingomonas sp. EC-HK361]|uniref:PepSY-associated TM helix domain-containing protein n=1 Tax=Sphingomonas sp. EC-HK361 TaxID=2038397 RepID=UPI001F1F3B4D|nr:PepSY-associated TM helix domain-containing protein [Sphingomonas sp. EC-HK361]
MTAAHPRPATFVQRALAGHAAIGLLVGALLYLVCLSGAIAVIHDRWQRWEQPNIAEMHALTPAAAQTAMTNVLASERGRPATTHLYIRMPTPDLPRAVVTTDSGGRYIDAQGGIAGREAHSWTEFVLALHMYLNLPMTWGMILVGALGVALAAAVVTGVLAHPRILRDAFTLRARHDSQIARADWHNRLGVWTLPFALAIALTGAFIGLGSVGFTVLAKAYSGGNLEAAYAPIFGAEATPDKRAAPPPDIARALTTLTARVPQASPTYVIVHDPGTRGQHVQIIAEHPRRLIYGETYAFDAAGRWRGAVGLADGAMGKQFAASTYNLHFGNFGGLAVELLYVLLGLALCVITATGTTLWLQKRRRRGLGSDRLDACWRVVVWGSPLAIVALTWVRALGGPDAPLAAWFWAMMAAGMALGMLRPSWIAAASLSAWLMSAIALTAGLHLAITLPSAGAVVALDLLGLGIPAVTLILSRYRSSGRKAADGQARYSRA